MLSDTQAWYVCCNDIHNEENSVRQLPSSQSIKCLLTHQIRADANCIWLTAGFWSNLEADKCSPEIVIQNSGLIDCPYVGQALRGRWSRSEVGSAHVIVWV